jgi:hypothetical protein
MCALKLVRRHKNLIKNSPAEIFSDMILLMWARRRQFFILCILIAFAVIGSFFVYRTVRKGPSCSDGVQNQGELGVDCGSPCSRVCSAEAAPLSVLWARVLKVADGQYDLSALVENPNPGFAASNLSYTFKIYDNQNVLIAEKSGVTFVHPKERFVIFLPNVDTGVRIPYRTFVDLALPAWQRIGTSYTKPSISLQNQSFTQDPIPRLSVELMNSGLTTLGPIVANAILSDANGNAFAVSATTLSGLTRGESQRVFFTWPQKFLVNPTVIDVYSRLATPDIVR